MKQKINFIHGAIALSVMAIITSCNKEIKQKDSTADLTAFSATASPTAGFVYTMNNEIINNKIICFAQNPDGTLTYKSSVNSGGVGTGAGLGSQKSLVMNYSHTWLYSVNAGDNSVSSFQINPDGSLALAHTVSSNGTMPVSVTVHGNWLYVVNSVTANISGYSIGAGGTMTYISGSNLPLSSVGAGPAQISFTPSGEKLIVTEKLTNKITTYKVDASGMPTWWSSKNSAGKEPFGFDFSGRNYMIVTEANSGLPNATTVTSYSSVGYGSVVSGPVTTQQTAACWATVSKDGKYAFTTNTGSNTISSFTVSNTGVLQLINGAEATPGAKPIDITFSGNEMYIYNINSGAHTITEYKRNNSQLQKIGEINVPVYAGGLAAF